MSYSPGSPRAFSAYNSALQSESSASYTLEFDTLKNMTQVSASVLNIPSDCFFTVDLKTRQISGQGNTFIVNYKPSSSSINGTIGNECTWAVGSGSPKGVPFTYGLLRGSATTTSINVNHQLIPSEPLGNNNRIVGLLL